MRHHFVSSRCRWPAESVATAIGQQAIRLVKRLAAEIGTMTEAQREDLNCTYLTNMCMVVA